MGKGNPISQEIKKIIYTLHVDNGLSAEDIFSMAFGSNASFDLSISLSRLQIICKNLDIWSVEEIHEWLFGEKKSWWPSTSSVQR
jgi:hypothetical protein